MSWELDDDHRDFRATCRAFVDRQVRPLADAAEAAGTFPAELWKELGGAGLLGLVTPAEHGGTGGDALAVALLAEELARANGGIAVTALVSAYMAAPHIVHVGSPDQQRRWLAPLVQEQFRIAAGAKLRTDAGPQPRGHAIEFRITCEDPARGFLPAPGTLSRWRMPSGPGIRVDSGVEQGDAADARFDSLMAKLIVTGADREQALRRSRRALAEVVIEGVPTPVPFYRRLLDHPAFAGDGHGFAVHNRWIESDVGGLLAPGAPAAPQEIAIRVGRRAFSVRLPGLAALGPGAADLREKAGQTLAGHDGPAAGNAVTAPMQGTVVAVAVQEGQPLAAGDLIATVEAMKMENRVLAHHAGTVTALAVATGATVHQGQVLCQVTPES